MTATAPAGITVSFTPASPVMLSPNKATNVTLTLVAASTATLGNDTVTVKGVSGANSQTAIFTLKVVQFLVSAAGNAFSPHVMNVTQGSTVYWQNYDGAAGQCNPGASTNGGQHNIVFTTLTGANSPTLKQFDIYQYTFNTPGSYFYYSGLDTDHLMNGTINVVAAPAGGGGMGMVAKMPAFSSLRDGGYASLMPVSMTPAHPTKQDTRESASPLTALGLALASIAVAGYSAFTIRGFELSLPLLAALALLLASSIRGRSRTKTASLGAVRPRIV